MECKALEMEMLVINWRTQKVQIQIYASIFSSYVDGYCTKKQRQLLGYLGSTFVYRELQTHFLHVPQILRARTDLPKNLYASSYSSSACISLEPPWSWKAQEQRRTPVQPTLVSGTKMAPANMLSASCLVTNTAKFGALASAPLGPMLESGKAGKHAVSAKARRIINWFFFAGNRKPVVTMVCILCMTA